MKNKKEHRKSAGGVHALQYHFVWCPKYRRGVLVGEVATELEKLLREKAFELGVEIISLAIRPDHVHCFITGTPSLAPYLLVHRLKGFTAHELRKRFPSLKTRLPSLWSRSYYVGSIGQAADETVRRYIEAQKGV